VKIGPKTRHAVYKAGTPARAGAFTLVEVLVAVFVLVIALVSLFGCFTDGFAFMEAAREDLRATQILVQKTEAIRLFTWSQLTNFTFSAYYDPQATNGSSGALYSGTVTTNAASTVPTSSAYYTNICLVTVTVSWTNNSLKKPVVHTRQAQTQVARYGMQNYIWGAH